jgi:putative superfamily III holin-X
VASDNGIVRATREVVGRARSVARLQVELALAEIKQKLARIGIGLGLTAGAALFALYAVGFLFAAAAAGLATAIPLWASLLIVGVVLVMIACLLVALAIRSFRAGAPPVPKHAIEEAKVTTETVRSNAAG